MKSRTTTSAIRPQFRRDDWGVTDIAQWDISPNLQVRNIFAYRETMTEPSYDYDGSSLPILEIVDSRTWQTNSAQVTEELHFSGHDDNNVWRWIAGYSSLPVRSSAWPALPQSVLPFRFRIRCGSTAWPWGSDWCASWRPALSPSNANGRCFRRARAPWRGFRDSRDGWDPRNRP